MLEHILTVRISDELKQDLKALAKLIESREASVARCGIEFYCWLVNNHHDNPYFQVLWESFCLEQNNQLKKLKKE